MSFPNSQNSAMGFAFDSAPSISSPVPRRVQNTTQKPWNNHVRDDASCAIHQKWNPSHLPFRVPLQNTDLPPHPQQCKIVSESIFETNL